MDNLNSIVFLVDSMFQIQIFGGVLQIRFGIIRNLWLTRWKLWGNSENGM
jgi:hypothetical protein